jgi:SAM-dependent methyltransferase
MMSPRSSVSSKPNAPFPRKASSIAMRPSGPEAHHSLAPSAWIERFAPLVAAGARVLDIAAGQGRHSRYFAMRGARVLAVDRDAATLAALQDCAGIDTRVADLEAGPWPFAQDVFDAIVVVNYLHRPLLPRLLDALATDGVLLYETFAVGNERFGRPSNPAFLLREEELLDLVRGRLTIVAFEQGRVDAERIAVLQRLAAVGRARAWPPALPGA